MGRRWGWLTVVVRDDAERVAGRVLVVRERAVFPAAGECAHVVTRLHLSMRTVR